MLTEHPHGKPLNVVKIIDDKLQVVANLLDLLLLNENVKERQIVAFSIVGAFRKGKSFFMDYCLRFMYANVSSL